MISRNSLGQSCRIAIVDDDEDVRVSLADLLRSYGYEVTDFASGEQFLSSSACSQADCIVSDMHMTGMSGIELARQLGRSRPPFILITAFSSQNLAALASDAGVSCVLRKPFGSEKLIAQLEQLILR